MMYKLYRGYLFHHSIGIPIIVLGLIIVFGAIGFKISANHTQNIMELSYQDIASVAIDNIYAPKERPEVNSDYTISGTMDLKQFQEILKKARRCEYETGTTEWYITLRIEVLCLVNRCMLR